MTYVFFVMTSVYILVEYVILHPWRFNLGFDAPTLRELGSYTNYLVGNSGCDARLYLIDYRHVGLSNRTGGYLGNVLAMPVLIAMTASFFYVSAREMRSFSTFLITTISVLLLLSSNSTTAVFAFIATILFYEIYVRGNITSLIIVALFCGALAIVLFTNRQAFYFFDRFFINLEDSKYVSTFLSSHLVLFRPENISYLLIGKWSWLPPEGGSSHVDFISIIVAYGGVVAYLLYRRMLKSAFSFHRFPDSHGRIFSMVVITAFICLLHASMTLNINVMLLVTLLYLKSGEIVSGLVFQQEKTKP
jgi:hypothetical protein